MKRKLKAAPAVRRFVAQVALPVAACAFGVSPASGAQPASRHMLDAERVIKVVSTSISSGRRQNPPPGIVGDTVFGSGRLRNAVPQFGKPKGAIVGRDRYKSVFLTSAIASVDVTATLPGGTIRARGKADFRLARNVIRVVGGTGMFAGAKGTAEERVTQSGETFNVYRLSTTSG